MPVISSALMAEDPKPVLVELEHVYPPIPHRGMDWAATLKEYYDPENGDPVGRGATQGEAISDLFEQVFDDFPKLEGKHSEMLEAILVYYMQEAIKRRVESWKYSEREAYCFEVGFKACMAEILSLLE